MSTIKTEDAERLMKQCRRGLCGRNALDDAHNLLAECYGTIGALVQERDRLRDAADAVVKRWDTPLWKDVPATAIYINKLRGALE